MANTKDPGPAGFWACFLPVFDPTADRKTAAVREQGIDWKSAKAVLGKQVNFPTPATALWSMVTTEVHTRLEEAAAGPQQDWYGQQPRAWVPVLSVLGKECSLGRPWHSQPSLQAEPRTLKLGFGKQGNLADTVQRCCCSVLLFPEPFSWWGYKIELQSLNSG